MIAINKHEIEAVHGGGEVSKIITDICVAAPKTCLVMTAVGAVGGYLWARLRSS
jgi:hypothetical protein